MAAPAEAGRGLKEFAAYARPRPRRGFALSVLLEVAYWPLLVASLSMLVGVLSTMLGMGLLGVGLVFLLVPTLVVNSAAEAFGRLRRRYRFDARRALEREDREPILYLRSFQFENFDRSLGGSQARYSFLEQENDDETLALVLKEVGPLVAVGRPSAKVPPPGALRLYFGNDEWEERVVELLKISRLVVIQPGFTDGLEKEMAKVKELPTEKVLYSFLGWQHRGRRWKEAEYGLFTMQVERIYGCRLPEKVGNAYFLFFTKGGEGGWTPHLVGLKGWKRFFFWLCSWPNLVLRLLNSEFAIRLLGLMSPMARLLSRLPVPRAFRAYTVAGVREALRPVLAEKGVGLPVWKTALFVVPVGLFICYLLSTIILPPAVK